jgi:two-component system NarL family sensor kinase
LTTIAELYAGYGDFNVEVVIDDGAVHEHRGMIFTAARELLANAAKHAAPRHVAVELSRDQRATRLRVADDGRGFNTSEMPSRLREGHIGLPTLIERIEALGGTMTISSTAGIGTEAEVCLPVRDDGDARNGANAALASVSED